MPTSYQWIEVTWDDSETDDGWEDTRFVKLKDEPPAHSAGVIIAEDDDKIILAADMSPSGKDTDQCNRRITIWKKNIIKRTRLYRRSSK